MKRLFTAIWEAEPAVIAMAAAFITTEILDVLMVDSPIATGAGAAATAVLALLTRHAVFAPDTARAIANEVIEGDTLEPLEPLL